MKMVNMWMNMLHNFRNSPSIVMWSIGNEVPSQYNAEGYKVSDFLQNICHREDPTRPTTSGIDQVSCILENGFASSIDVPGLNYRTQRYVETYEKMPQKLILGSETASTVSSRGIYKFPVEKGPMPSMMIINHHHMIGKSVLGLIFLMKILL